MLIPEPLGPNPKPKLMHFACLSVITGFLRAVSGLVESTALEEGRGSLVWGLGSKFWDR